MNKRPKHIIRMAIFGCGLLVVLVLAALLWQLAIPQPPSYYRVKLINNSQNRIDSVRLITWLEGSMPATKPAGEKFYYDKNLGALDKGQRLEIALESGQVGEGTLFVRVERAGRVIDQPVLEYVTQGLSGSADVCFEASGKIEVTARYGD